MKKDHPDKGSIRWLRIIFGMIFLAGLFHIVYDDEKIIESDLVTLNLTVSGELQKGSSTNPFKIKIQSSEHKCIFGIHTAGVFGIKPEIKENIKPGLSITVKIHNTYVPFLESPDETIPVYFLKSGGRVLFDVQKYNDAKDKINLRWLGFLGVICLIFLIKEIFF